MAAPSTPPADGAPTAPPPAPMPRRRRPPPTLRDLAARLLAPEPHECMRLDTLAGAAVEGLQAAAVVVEAAAAGILVVLLANVVYAGRGGARWKQGDWGGSGRRRAADRPLPLS